MKCSIQSKSVLILVVCSWLAGCASNDENQSKQHAVDKLQRMAVKKSVLSNTNAEKPDVNEQVGPSAKSGGEQNGIFSSQKVEGIGGLSKLSETAIQSPDFDDVHVSFVVDDISLTEFTSQLYGEILNLNYVIAPEIQADNETISMSISEAISKSELYQIANTALALRGIILLRKNDIIYIQKISERKKKNDVAVGIGNQVSDIPEGVGELTQIVPYIYSESRNISNVMSKLSSAKLTILSKQKLIIIEGERSEIERALKLINMLDVPRAFGREIRLLEFSNVSPDDAAAQIRLLLDEDGFARSSNGDYSFVTMPRINTLVAYAANQKIVDRIMYWAQKLDVPLAGDEPRFYVFKPSFSKASDLMGSISGLLVGVKSDRKEESTVVDNSGSQNSRSQRQASSSSITMSFDETQNALLFHATPAEYRQVLDLLTKLDQLPGQIIIDAAIVEVTLSDDVSSGIDWIFNSRGQASTDGLVANLTSSEGLLGAIGIAGDWQATLSLLEKQTDARVLSKPYLVVQDGMTANLNSGDQIPITTNTVQDVGDSDTVANEVAYRSTGTQVSFTPTINSEGVISLEVSVSVSSSGGGSLTPTITSRSLTTSILAIDGQTVVLGGMIQETTEDADNKVPLLGDIPILGRLFQQKSDEYTRTELIMLITTKIVKSSKDIDEFGRKMAELYSIPVQLD